MNDDDLHIDTYEHDDDLLAAAQEERRSKMRVYRLHETVVVLGRGSKPEVELDLSACRQDRVSLLRRHGGGCAVVIDPGNVIVSVALPLSGLGSNKQAFSRLSRWISEGLARIGLDGVTHQGISDLVFLDRKVGGACIYRRRDLLYYSTTVLVSPNIALMERYLQHPPREPEYRRGRTHLEFVSGLARAPGARSVDQVLDGLRRTLNLKELGLSR